MSLLRLSRPGQPTVLIDLGPDTGRTTHTRGMVKGGAIVEVAKKPSTRHRDYQAENARRTKKGGHR
jgi:hypothetical protein